MSVSLRYSMLTSAGEHGARARHLHALAAQGAVDVKGRRHVLEAERQRIQLLLDGHGGVVADGADGSALAVERGERLQYIVQLRGGEIDGHALVAVDRAGVLKVAHAVFVEHDLAYRQVDGGRDGGRGRRRRFGGGNFGGLGGKRERRSEKQNGKKGTAHDSSSKELGDGHWEGAIVAASRPMNASARDSCKKNLTAWGWMKALSTLTARRAKRFPAFGGLFDASQTIPAAGGTIGGSREPTGPAR